MHRHPSLLRLDCRYKYLQNSKGKFENPFDKGVVANWLQFLGSERVHKYTDIFSVTEYSEPETHPHTDPDTEPDNDLSHRPSPRPPLSSSSHDSQHRPSLVVTFYTSHTHHHGCSITSSSDELLCWQDQSFLKVEKPMITTV